MARTFRSWALAERHSRNLVGGLVLAVAFAGCCQPAAAAEPSAPRTILLYAGNEAGMRVEVLDRAKLEVCRIYREIGIEAVWEDDVTGTIETYDVPVRRLFVMILPPKMASRIVVNAAALGGAMTTSKTRGRRAYIFSKRVEQVATGYKTDIAVVLYAVPGALIGIALVYLEGIRRERQAGVTG